MAAMEDVIPKAVDCRKRIADTEGQKVSEMVKKTAAAEAEQKALLDQLSKPSGVSDEERMKRAANLIKRAVDNGLMEIEVGRFPNQLFTDRGRAINQMEPGWETTLTGLPKELFEFWKMHLRPRGYKLKCQIAEFPGGMPGDIGMILSWE